MASTSEQGWTSFPNSAAAGRRIEPRATTPSSAGPFR